jgi:hypothetical protein
LQTKNLIIENCTGSPAANDRLRAAFSARHRVPEEIST